MDTARSERNDTTIFAATKVAAEGGHVGSPLEVLRVFLKLGVSCNPSPTLAISVRSLFASEFDPQPYHLDETAAERTPLKGLAASGWHTAAIAMRLAFEVRPFRAAPSFGARRGRLTVACPRAPRRCDEAVGEVRVEPRVGRGRDAYKGINHAHTCA
jgi:MaoC like domain